MWRILDISLDTANKFYAFGWRFSLIGALITAIGVAFLFWGTRVRDQDFDSNIADLHQRAALYETQSKGLEKDNLILQRDLEKERAERLKLEQKFSARNFTERQRLNVINVLKGRYQRVCVRCIDEIEACIAAENFATSFREAGIDVPPVEGVGMTFPPSTGIEVYDPEGENGLFAKTVLSALVGIPGSRFRPKPFVIAGVALDPANPSMVVRMKIPAQSSK